MTLYADILFLVNFIMNGFVLWILAKVMRETQKKRWFFLGAGVMALLYTILIITPLRLISVVFASPVILAAGIGIVFRPQTAGAFFRLMAAAYVIIFMPAPSLLM
jgi:hypothetical protein